MAFRAFPIVYKDLDSLAKKILEVGVQEVDLQLEVRCVGFVGDGDQGNYFLFIGKRPLSLLTYVG